MKNGRKSERPNGENGRATAAVATTAIISVRPGRSKQRPIRWAVYACVPVRVCVDGGGPGGGFGVGRWRVGAGGRGKTAADKITREPPPPPQPPPPLARLYNRLHCFPLNRKRGGGGGGFWWCGSAAAETGLLMCAQCSRRETSTVASDGSFQ